jgi:hypothetical protein
MKPVSQHKSNLAKFSIPSLDSKRYQNQKISNEAFPKI